MTNWVSQNTLDCRIDQLLKPSKGYGDRNLNSATYGGQAEKPFPLHVKCCRSYAYAKGRVRWGARGRFVIGSGR